MNYIRSEDYNLGNVISDIVLEDIIEANPTETWENNEQILVNLVSSGNFTDTNTQERIICGFNIDIGTVAYGARPVNNEIDLESMML
jgi:hypothetical protein